MRSERGSAPVESLFAIVLLMLLVVGAIQVALSLYGRNVVAAAAHEAARAAVERAVSLQEAHRVAVDTVRRAGGRLVQDLSVDVFATDDERGRIVRVEIVGSVDVLGPVPVPLAVRARATARSEGEIR